MPCMGFVTGLRHRAATLAAIMHAWTSPIAPDRPLRMSSSERGRAMLDFAAAAAAEQTQTGPGPSRGS